MTNLRIALALAILISCAAGSLRAQGYQPGSSYYSTDNYIEYQAGNMPLIISVPHGGRLEPTTLPDRSCDGCVYVMDSYTQELAREIRDAFVRQTGCYPHVVYNLLHRKKLDMNRDSVEATDSNTALGAYWQGYHDFIDSAKHAIMSVYGKGLFIDLHGHGHTKQRIEYGYLLTGTNLRESDSAVNTSKRVNISPIRNLVSSNPQRLSHAELIRGSQALGTLFADQGFPGVPTQQDPFPLADDDYFNGGYNTLVHGSRTSGSIDAIQMELYSAIRFNTAQRAAFAEAFAATLRNYLGRHVLEGYEQRKCALTSIGELHLASVSIVPNPAHEQFLVTGLPSTNDEKKLCLIDIFGKEVITQTTVASSCMIDIHEIVPGPYVLRALDRNNMPLFMGCVIVR